MNIVVLAGGLSSERDVSLATGGQIANALTGNGHKILLVDCYIGLSQLDTFENLYAKYKKEDYTYKIPDTPPDLSEIKRKYGDGDALIGKNVLEVCKMADCVFIGLHGAIGENGQLQAMFDIYGIRYTGSGYIGCLLSMDKAISKEIMAVNNIPTAPYLVMNMADLQTCEMELPYVVKPCNGGSSIGVTLVKTKEDVEEALSLAQIYDDKFLIEKYIAGRELSVGVLDGEALPAIEIIPPNDAEFFDFSSKYQGTTSEVCPADIPEELEMKMRELALKVHKALRLEKYSRTDFIVDEQGVIYCLEANSLPGLTANSLLPQEAREAGIGYGELCERIVGL